MVTQSFQGEFFAEIKKLKMKISRLFLLSVVLVVFIAALAQASQSKLFKRGKKNPPKSTGSQYSTKSGDNDDDLLNEAIDLNKKLAENKYDLSQFYDISKMNKDKYMKTITEAYEFAKGMFKGTHIEVKEWLAKPEILEDSITDAVSRMNITNSGRSILAKNVFFELSAMETRATETRSKWYLYQIALKNLIAYGKPHPAFYELFTNIFFEIDILNYKIALSKIESRPLYESFSYHGEKYGAMEASKLFYELASINFDLNSPHYQII